MTERRAKIIERSVTPMTPAEALRYWRRRSFEQRLRIVRTPGICGGSARVHNTRIPVWTLVEAQRRGASIERLIADFPSLTAGDIRAAWKYAADHSDEIDIDLLQQE